ncbi:MAG: glycosyltransferase [Candidatus Bathyarchaeia archaeon]
MKKLNAQPLVSVIVPTYNSSRNIAQCLKSIRNQTYKRVEILIVDRCSRDKTKKIAEELGAKVFLLDGERSEARNYAAKKARGDFLLFIDSDMMLTHEVIEACVDSCLRQGADAVIIPEKYAGYGLLSELRKREKNSLSANSELMEIPRFFKKSVFLELGGYDEELVCGEDFEFFQRFRKEGYKVYRISQEIIHFEGKLTLNKIFSKAYYYGETIPALIKKEPTNTIKRYATLRLISVKNAKSYYENFSSAIGFSVMKIFELTAYFLGMLSGIAKSFSEKCKDGVLRGFLVKNKTAILNISIIVAIATVIFRNFLFTDEWPGGGDVLGFVSRAYLYGKDLRWLLMWRPYSFGFVEGINFMDFFLMLLYYVFRSPSWTVKVFMFLSYITAGFSMYIFAYRYTKSHVASLAASLVYILNQWLFSQLTEAHVDIIYSYALAPLIFIALDKALQMGKPKHVLILSLSLSLFITSFHPEFIVIYGVFLTLFTVFLIFYPVAMETVKTRFLRFFKVAFPSALLVFVFSAFFLIPFIINIRSPYFHPSYEYPLEDAYSCSYQNLFDAFVLRAVEKWGYNNILDVSTQIGIADFPLYNLLFILFLISYCTLLIRRDRYTVFFAVAMLISVFVAKGPNSPFGQFFIWAWFNIPHFAIFRAANRWVAMAIFSHALFTSLLTYYLTDYVKSRKYAKINEFLFKARLKVGNFSRNKLVVFSLDSFNAFLKKVHKLIHFISVILLILIFISGFLACSFFLFQGVHVYTPPEQYLAPYEWLSLQQDDYKVVSVGRSSYEWLVSPDEYSDFASSAMQTTLGWGHDIGFDSVFIHDKPVLQDGGWNFRARKFVDHLRFRLAREHLTDNLFKILGTFAYKYIVIPPYATNKTRDFFLSQEGYRVIYNDTALILQNEYATPRFFAVTNSMLVVGGLESFDALCKIDNFRLNETALFFVPAQGDSDSFGIKFIDNFQMMSFVNSDILDLALLSYVGEKSFILAGEYGASSINYTGYWIKGSSWRILGALVLSGDTLTTSGKNRIDIPFELDEGGQHDFWLRIGFAPCRGKLNIYVDGEPIREIRAEAQLWSKLLWINVARLELVKGRHIVTLENDGTGYNDIDAIAFIKPSELESRIKEITRTLQDFSGRILCFYEAENLFLDSSGGGWTWTLKPNVGYMIRSESYGLNVAPLASASASSTGWIGDYQFEARYANDDNAHTRWASERSVLPQWLELSWEKPQQILGVRLFFEDAYAKDYLIQTWNGAEWITQIEVANNSALERTHIFAEPVETHKLRILVTEFSIHDLASIWEIQAYAPGATSSAEILVPRSGNYMLATRISKGPSYGQLYLSLDDKAYTIQCTEPITTVEWCEIGPFSLEEGQHQISVGGSGPVELDSFILYSLGNGEEHLALDDLFAPKGDGISITYEKVNPCLFRAYINANEAFTLIFSDTYDPLWKAFIDGEAVSPHLAYSIVNSYFINRTGQFTITIYFAGQFYADMGLIISISSFISAFIVASVFALLSYKRLFGKRGFWRRLAFWRRAS